MRITTQMLADTAAKSGIPFQRTTLLDMINNKSTSGMLNNISNSSDASAILSERNYSKLEKSSDSLYEYAQKLAATDKDSVYDKSASDTKEIVTDISELVDNYNTTIKQLQTTGGTLNSFYLKQMKELISDSKEALEGIGITQAKDGSLVIDDNALKKADVDTLKKVFGGEAGLAAKLGILGKHVSDNAAANLASISNQYTANGTSSINSFEASKYDYLG